MNAFQWLAHWAKRCEEIDQHYDNHDCHNAPDDGCRYCSKDGWHKEELREYMQEDEKNAWV